MKIREMRPEDWNDVRRIYLEGIATGIATFQQSAPEYEDWDRGHLADCRLVAEEEGHILGWTALSATSSRPVYRGVVEVSLYVGADSRGKGVGKALMLELIARVNALGKTVVMVLHDLSLAFSYSHQVVVLEQGKIAAQGEAQPVFDSGVPARVFGVSSQCITLDGREEYLFLPH